MDSGWITSIMLVVNFLIPLFCLVGIFYTIKYFIKYNAEQKRIHSEQSEMDRMKIDDLE